MNPSEVDHSDEHQPRNQIGMAFENNRDPLAEPVGTFQQLDVDLLNAARSEFLHPKRFSEPTHKGYRRVVDQWQAHMTE